MMGSNCQGMTLLETLAVLMLMGLALSLSLPRIESIYNSVQLALNIEDFKLAVEQLPEQARHAQAPIYIEEFDETAIAAYGLPVVPGWILSVNEPVRISQQGFCLGGNIALFDGRSIVRYEITAPYCHLKEMGGS